MKLSEAEIIASQFKCRSSNTGDMMTNGRSKGDALGETCKTMLKEWINQKIFNRYKSFTSKYTEKGTMTEEDGITLIALKRGKMYRKNTERKENEFLIGECDIWSPKESLVIDNKSSYELSTYPMWTNDLKNKDNELQVISYADLWKAENAMVYYTLNNMKAEQLESQLQQYSSMTLRYNENGLTDLQIAEFVNQRIFTLKEFEIYQSSTFPDLKDYKFIEISEERRCKGFEVEVNSDKINPIYERVELCRKEIANYLVEFL